MLSASAAGTFYHNCRCQDSHGENDANTSSCCNDQGNLHATSSVAFTGTEVCSPYLTDGLLRSDADCSYNTIVHLYHTQWFPPGRRHSIWGMLQRDRTRWNTFVDMFVMRAADIYRVMEEGSRKWWLGGSRPTACLRELLSCENPTERLPTFLSLINNATFLACKYG